MKILLALTVAGFPGGEVLPVFASGAAPSAIAASGAPSLAAEAVARGDFAAARGMPAQSLEEALYLEASVALAEHRIDVAQALVAFLPPGEAAAEIGWRLAHAQQDSAAIAARAAVLCTLGDRTGRSCADAELYGRSDHVRSRVELLERTEVRLSPTAPLPALAVSVVGDLATHRLGAVVDTGASQTVLSSSAAAALGVVPTSASFPVAVAAGGAQTTGRLGVLRKLEVGRARVSDLPVLVLDMPELERRGISLIVSPQHAFDGLRVIFDFERHTLCIEESDDAGAGTGQVPYYGVGFDLAVRARVGDGPEGLFGIDTGLAGAFALSRAYASSTTPIADVLVEGAGQRAPAVRVAPLTVTVGPQTLVAQAPCLVSDVPALQPIGLQGFLGNGLWGNGRLVMDTRTRRLAIHVPPPAEIPAK